MAAARGKCLVIAPCIVPARQRTSGDTFKKGDPPQAMTSRGADTLCCGSNRHAFALCDRRCPKRHRLHERSALHVNQSRLAAPASTNV